MSGLAFKLFIQRRVCKIGRGREEQKANIANSYQSENLWGGIGVSIFLLHQLFCGFDDYKIKRVAERHCRRPEVVTEGAARPKAVGHPRVGFRMTP